METRPINNSPMVPVQVTISDERFSKEDLASIHKSAQEFEALFTQIMLKSMRDSVHSGGLVDGGNGEDIFRSMLDTEYAKSMANTGQFGIASLVERQLLGLDSRGNISSAVKSSQKGMDVLKGMRAYQGALAPSSLTGLSGELSMTGKILK